jgi:hypothetical protein
VDQANEDRTIHLSAEVVGIGDNGAA